MITNIDNSSDDQGLLFNKIIPEDDRFQDCHSVLQCGARIGDGWRQIFQGFQDNAFTSFEILEVFDENVEWLRNQRIWPCAIHHGDIRHIGTDKISTLRGKHYDVVTFWHGPEHIDRREFSRVLNACKQHLNAKVFIAGAPWGKWEQQEIKGNPYERHVTHWYPWEWEAMGFDVWTFNDPAKKPGANNHNVMFGIIEL